MCVAILGTALSAAGSFTEAKAAQDTAIFQAGVLRYNQITAARLAADARTRGDGLRSIVANPWRWRHGRRPAALSNGVTS